jgi:hypothetical protein
MQYGSVRIQVEQPKGLHKQVEAQMGRERIVEVEHLEEERLLLNKSSQDSPETTIIDN